MCQSSEGIIYLAKEILYLRWDERHLIADFETLMTHF